MAPCATTTGWQAVWQRRHPIDEAFQAALEDDLNTPRALAALFELAREIHREEDATRRGALAARLRASAELLGLMGADPEAWFQAAAGGDLDAEKIEAMLAERRAARTRRDFAAADRIRDELAARGVVIEDRADGTRWRIDNPVDAE